MLLPFFLCVIFALHHNASHFAPCRLKRPHIQVDCCSKVDSPDNFTDSSFLFLYRERKQNVCLSPLSPPRNSVRPWQRTEDLWNNLLLTTPPPARPPLSLSLLKIMNSEPHSHSCAQPSEEAPPLLSWANGAQSSLIILIPGWPIAHLSPAHMTPFCALPLLSALNPGECRHHWRPDTGAIGRPLSSAEFTRRYLMQTLSPSDEADRSVDENDPASPEEQTSPPLLSLSKRPERRRGETITPRSYWNHP